MSRIKPLILLIIVILAITMWQQHATAPGPSADGQFTPTPAQSVRDDTALLPAQARDMLQRIQRGGPFAHRQDGTVFGNYEGLLPRQPRGYYHEYTVDTPGAHNRGARRIITGGTPPVVWYYTGDHYRSFQRIEVQP